MKWLLCLALCLCLWHGSDACSNLLVSKGATDDGTTIISYSADSSNVMGDIYTWPAANHTPGDLREIYEWDTGAKLGAIPQPPHTFNVIGNTNEHQVSIFETTFGGLTDLAERAVCHPQYGCIDYGQLIWVTLQRARTAAEAVSTIDYLLQTYGYASEGESFSIADPHEVWLMELIGKGAHAQGAVWVAQKVPEGYVGAHANQARIQTFNLHDNATSRFSPDVVSFARLLHLYNGTDQDFSFSDVYDPVTFTGARFCEARVFTFFSAVAAPEEDIGQYLSYAQGYNLTNRMPLFVKAGHKIGVNETMWHMRNHFEGTWFETSSDVGSQQWSDPHRLGEGLTWSEEGSSQKYVNERPIGTQYAGWNVIGNQRSEERYSVLWFGADDSTFSLHTPFYGATSSVPAAWSGGDCTNRMSCKTALGLPGTMMDFTMDSQHWVQNLIANYAYSRYDQVAPAVQGKLVEVEADLFERVRAMDAQLHRMHPGAAAAAAATAFSYQTAERLHKMWKGYFGTLFVTFVDGYRAVPDSSNLATGMKKITPGFSPRWKKRIIADAGDKYKIPPTLSEPLKGRGTIDKLSLRGLGGPGRPSRSPRSEL